DGEVVCFDELGRTSFRQLQQRFHLANAAEVQLRSERYPASVFLFDVLFLNGRDVRRLPLEERKRLLRRAVRWSERVRWTESQPAEGKRLLRAACRAGGEGIMGKRRASPYLGGRSRDWVKIKCVGRQEFIIGGFTDPQRARV